MITLYDYWRSSASYRVRIALGLAGLGWTSVPVDLVNGGQTSPDHLARNPQGLVPVMEIDGAMLTQSLAIIEYLDESQAWAYCPPHRSHAPTPVRLPMQLRWICIRSVIRVWRLSRLPIHTPPLRSTRGCRRSWPPPSWPSSRWYLRMGAIAAATRSRLRISASSRNSIMRGDGRSIWPPCPAFRQ